MSWVLKPKRKKNGMADSYSNSDKINIFTWSWTMIPYSALRTNIFKRKWMRNFTLRCSLSKSIFTRSVKEAQTHLLQRLWVKLMMIWVWIWKEPTLIYSQKANTSGVDTNLLWTFSYWILPFFRESGNKVRTNQWDQEYDHGIGTLCKRTSLKGEVIVELELLGHQTWWSKVDSTQSLESYSETSKISRNSSVSEWNRAFSKRVSRGRGRLKKQLKFDLMPLKLLVGKGDMVEG
jgi:hypothetical protein